MAVIITMIVLFIGGTCVLTYFGLPFLAFLLFYVDVWIYCLWKNHVKRTFYKVPDGAKRCELIYVKDIAFLDLLNSQTASRHFATFQSQVTRCLIFYITDFIVKH